MSSFFDTYQKEIIQATFNLDVSLKDPKFRNFVIQQKGKSLETIKLFRESMASTLKKPQKCLYSDDDYYIAVDTLTSTYYVCFRDLLMVDIDIPKEVDSDDAITDLERLETHLKLYNDKHPESLIEVYKTRNGFHCFLLHRKYDYNSDEAVKVMLDLHCDFYYTIYAHLRGWSVRLNRKANELELSSPIYKKIGRYGKGKPDTHLEKLANLHINLLDSFDSGQVSLMR